MLFPYATDAPIYYFPFATIGLIIANVAAFVASSALVADQQPTFDLTQLERLSEESIERLTATDVETKSKLDPFLLQFDRIAPGQWLTTNFLHADVGHLLGNMLFLWAFGLIVEGKIGWARFLILYLAVGLAYAAIVQIGMFLFSDGIGSALGASGVIFGVMAIAVCWAPKNEMSCLTWFYIPRVYEIPILLIGFVYFTLQLFFLGLQGFQMSSELLHMVGLLVGLPVGLLMVKWKWVDCEGWDLLSVLAGKEGRPSVDTEAILAKTRSKQSATAARDRAITLQSVQSALQANNADVAVRLLAKQLTVFDADHPIPEPLSTQLIQQLHAAKRWEDSVPWMEQLVTRSESALPAYRVKLAQILIQVSNRPTRALRILADLPSDLSPKQAEMRRKLTRIAEQRLAEGTGEVEIE